MLDYYAIGQKIRKYRREKGLSQEQVAEKVGISVTHMCHIETGKTKLSLPVLVDLSRVLKTSIDELLNEPSERDAEEAAEELAQILSRCTSTEVKAIMEIARFVKYTLDTYREK